uniref:Uncharacterized protein n=1 Tax=Utricularia reniformis TaxID=192314 RepID=A0A1Y0B123_9LAMI|nr:hypothetical protein AEK19_MT0814 [Utricularia reniformis]ART31049.1 hypothetical protein AEK19_MT0814 [Utricularia reniformis]
MPSKANARALSNLRKPFYSALFFWHFSLLPSRHVYSIT